MDNSFDMLDVFTTYNHFVARLNTEREYVQHKSYETFQFLIGNGHKTVSEIMDGVDAVSFHLGYLAIVRSCREYGVQWTRVDNPAISDKERDLGYFTVLYYVAEEGQDMHGPAPSHGGGLDMERSSCITEPAVSPRLLENTNTQRARVERSG